MDLDFNDGLENIENSVLPPILLDLVNFQDVIAGLEHTDLVEYFRDTDSIDYSRLRAVLFAHQRLSNHMAVTRERISRDIDEDAVVLPDNLTGRALLHDVVVHGSLADLDRVLDICADVNIKDRCGDTVLSLAAWVGKTDMVEMLLSEDPAVDECARDGKTALMYATYSGLCMTNLLLDAKADANLRDNTGETALMIASRLGKVDVMRALITAKAHVNVKNEDGYSSLYYACKYEHPGAVALLLEAGASLGIMRIIPDQDSELSPVCEEKLISGLIDPLSPLNTYDHQEKERKTMDFMVTPDVTGKVLTGETAISFIEGYAARISLEADVAVAEVAGWTGNPHIVRLLLEWSKKTDAQMQAKRVLGDLAYAASLSHFGSTTDTPHAPGTGLNAIMGIQVGASCHIDTISNVHTCTTTTTISPNTYTPTDSGMKNDPQDNYSKKKPSIVDDLPSSFACLLVSEAKNGIITNDGTNSATSACTSAADTISLPASSATTCPLAELSIYTSTATTPAATHTTAGPHAAGTTVATDFLATTEISPTTITINAITTTNDNTNNNDFLQSLDPYPPLSLLSSSTTSSHHVPHHSPLTASMSSQNAARPPSSCAPQASSPHDCSLDCPPSASLTAQVGTGVLRGLASRRWWLTHVEETFYPNQRPDNLLPDQRIEVPAEAASVAALLPLVRDTDVNLNAQDTHGRTVLMLACESGNRTLVWALTQAGVAADVYDEDGETALLYACNEGDVYIIDALIRSGYVDVHRESRAGVSPLLRVCTLGHWRAALRLIAAGADVNACDEDGYSVLMSVCERECTQNDRKFAENILDVFSEESQLNGLLAASINCTPLSLATSSANAPTDTHTSTAMSLPLLTSVTSCMAPLPVLAYMESLSMTTPYISSLTVLKALIIAKCDLNATDLSGRVALHCACEQNNVKKINVLLENKADVDIRDDYGKTPLMMACLQGYTETVSILLQALRDSSIRNKSGKRLGRGNFWIRSSVDSEGSHGMGIYAGIGTAICPGVTVVAESDTETAAISATTTTSTTAIAAPSAGTITSATATSMDMDMDMVSATGADCVDNMGETALMYACKHGSLNVVQQLLNFGANVNIASKEGLTAIFFACKYQYYDIVELLVKRGADLCLRSKNNRTIFMYACEGGDRRIVNFIGKQMLCMSYSISKLLPSPSPIPVQAPAPAPVPVPSIYSDFFYGFLLDRDEEGKNALMYACEYGHADIASSLSKILVSISKRNHAYQCRGMRSPPMCTGTITTADTTMANDTPCVCAFCACDIYGRNCLLLSCISTNISCIEVFFTHPLHLDANICDNDGKGVLMYACIYSCNNITYLLQKNADISRKDRNGKTALMHACEHGNYEAVEMLLNAMKSDSDADDNANDDDNDHSNGGNDEITTYTTYLNTDNTDRSNVNHSETAQVHAPVPIREPVLKNSSLGVHVNPEMLVSLGPPSFPGSCDQGIRKNRLNPKYNIDERDNSGRTALMWASFRGDKSVIELLLDYGADKRLQDSQRISPLMFACMHGHQEAILALQPTAEDILDFDAWGRNALTMTYDEEIIHSFIVTHGIDINTRDQYNNTVLMNMISENDNSRQISGILAMKADISIRNDVGKTAVDIAAIKGNGPVLQVLLESMQGNLARQRDVAKKTLWQLARCRSILTREKVQGVVFAVNNVGISINTRDDRGRSALMRACAAGNSAVVSGLLFSGADIHAVDVFGLTCLHYAARADHSNVIAVLLRNIWHYNGITGHVLERVHSRRRRKDDDDDDDDYEYCNTSTGSSLHDTDVGDDNGGDGDNSSKYHRSTGTGIGVGTSNGTASSIGTNSHRKNPMEKDRKKQRLPPGNPTFFPDPGIFDVGNMTIFPETLCKALSCHDDHWEGSDSEDEEYEEALEREEENEEEEELGFDVDIDMGDGRHRYSGSQHTGNGSVSERYGHVSYDTAVSGVDAEDEAREWTEEKERGESAVNTESEDWERSPHSTRTISTNTPPYLSFGEVVGNFGRETSNIEGVERIGMDDAVDVPMFADITGTTDDMNGGSDTLGDLNLFTSLAPTNRKDIASNTYSRVTNESQSRRRDTYQAEGAQLPVTMELMREVSVSAGENMGDAGDSTSVLEASIAAYQGILQ